VSGAFFDSNILLYSIHKGEARRERASALIRAGGTISVQCLNEFAVVANRKLKMPWDRITEARDTIISLCHVVPVSIDVHLLGTSIAERYRLSVYDSMIVAAAIGSGCGTLYSEDGD
jgi:predicted nucleic acid-binding protein